MQEIRCGNCRRKLAEGVYTVLAIKCPRCGVINNLKANEPPSAASVNTGGHHGNQAGKPARTRP